MGLKGGGDKSKIIYNEVINELKQLSKNAVLFLNPIYNPFCKMISSTFTDPKRGSVYHEYFTE